MICKNPRCRNEFVPRNKKRRYCCDACRTRHNSRKRYKKIKNNPEYKKYQRIKFKEWLINNREHYNDLCRERSRIGNYKLYHKRKDKGLCPECGKKVDDKKYIYCTLCRENERKYGNEKKT